MTKNLIILFSIGILIFAEVVSGQDRIFAPSGDYNGDGLTDIAVFRQDSGLWSIRGLGNTYFGRLSTSHPRGL